MGIKNPHQQKNRKVTFSMCVDYSASCNIHTIAVYIRIKKNQNDTAPKMQDFIYAITKRTIQQN